MLSDIVERTAVVPAPQVNYYDVEVLLYRFRHADPQGYLSTHLAHLGDSIVMAPGNDLLKVHVHTDQPVLLVEQLLVVGDIRQMEWLDMRWQNALHRRESGPDRVTVVAPADWHPVFDGLSRVLTPEDAVDAEGVLWISPPGALTNAFAVPSLAQAGQLILEYAPDQSWQENCQRLSKSLSAMRVWTVYRNADGYRVDGTVVSTLDEAINAVGQLVPPDGVVTGYLSRGARREEASGWQGALNAELVQVPRENPWLEIVWQP